MNYDVFISYSRHDYIDENKVVIPGSIVSEIKKVLTANGISYWFDEDGINHGDEFAPIIARNIKDASIFLFISTENSNASEWTSREIAVANAYKKKIIPFRYDDSVYNDSVILFVANLDYIDYASNPSNALTRLVASIKENLKEIEEQRELEIRRKEEERRRREDEEKHRLQQEASLKERAERIESMRQRIVETRNRIFELDTEILAVEKTLDDFREKRRVFNADLNELIAQERQLSGVNRNEGSPVKHKNFIARWWQSIKDAVAERSLVANITLFAIFATAMLCLGLTVLAGWVFGVGSHHTVDIFLCSLAGVVVAFKMLENRSADSIVTLFNLVVCPVLCWKYYAGAVSDQWLVISLREFASLIAEVTIIILVPLFLVSLFTSKNGVKFYKVLRGFGRPIYKNVSLILYVLLGLIAVALFF